MASSPDKPTVLFVTDPLCSWCWGMLPQIEHVRAALADRARFDLLMAGLQIGGTAGLSEFEGARLRGVERVLFVELRGGRHGLWSCCRRGSSSSSGTPRVAA